VEGFRGSNRGFFVEGSPASKWCVRVKWSPSRFGRAGLYLPLELAIVRAY
jgi:hypothetical protein